MFLSQNGTGQYNDQRQPGATKLFSQKTLFAKEERTDRHPQLLRRRKRLNLG